MGSIVEITCYACGKKFTRRKAEVNRSRKRGRQSFCSYRCAGGAHYEHLVPYQGDVSRLDSANRKDDLSPFRYHYNRIRRSGKPCAICLSDLKEQWEKQRGFCPYTGFCLYTGWRLRNSCSQTERNKGLAPKAPDSASVDRIDSSRGYTKDNIQFVSLMAQYAKNCFSEHQLIGFCEAVVRNNIGP